jgi:chemotaxis protein methyltransferase CheR
MRSQPLDDRLSKRNFDLLSKYIYDYSGIKMPHSKMTMLEGRLRRRLRVTAMPTFDSYCDYLFKHGGIEAESIFLIDAVTTNKTDFFREPQHFTFMREVAVPALSKLHGRKSASLKIWSSASSTGMEAYTTAMVLDDMIRTGSRFQFRILGTDISTAVLRLAKTAIYTRDVLAPVPEPFLKRYFLSSRDKSRGEMRVIPELRRMTHFMRMNLMDASYPVDRDVDIIFCRNVLIYFDRPTQRKVVEQLCNHLRPGGYLLVGHSESMVHSAVPGLKQVQPTIFQV